jgi:hypothetical protein
VASDRTMRPFRLAACAAALLLAAPAAAQTSGRSDGDWQYSVTPYVWLPSIHGTQSYDAPPGGGRPEVETGANDYLQHLDMALFLTGEARKGAWAVFTDFIYLDFSNEAAEVKAVRGPGGAVQVPLNTQTQSELKGRVWQVAASYALSRSATSSFEVLGGFRYLGIETTVNWRFAGPIGLLPQSGSLTQKEDLWDAIVGVRGRAKLGDGNWFVPWYLDAGTGSSDLTWQGMAGIGYTWKWGDALLAYRHLSYDQGEGKLVQDVRFSGPMLGATFRF